MPWSSGSTPVMNEGQADQECVGTTGRRPSRWPLSRRAWRLGRAPCSSRGSRMRQSAPSHAIKMTRDMQVSASQARSLNGGECTEGLLPSFGGDHESRILKQTVVSAVLVERGSTSELSFENQTLSA